MKLRIKKIVSLALVLVFVFSATNSVMAAQSSYKMLNVPYDNQCGVESGCEAVSSTMLLRYYGYHVDKKSFARNTLIKGNWYVDSRGQMYGPDPNAAYVGDPFKGSGYNCGFGCYANATAKSINKFLGNKAAYKAVVTSGKSLNQLVNDYINKNMPVLVWATMDMKKSYPSCSWIINYTDGSSGLRVGDRYTWTAGEHCLVLVGYDRDRYYFNDPYKNHGRVSFSKGLVEQRFRELKSQSVVMVRR
mgnify:CR=1 FL=1